MADSAENGIGGVADSALEIASTEVTLGFQGGVFGAIKRFWPEMKTRCGFEAL